MEISGEQGSLQMAVSVGVGKQALQTTAQLSSDLMSKTLENTQNIARAESGIGTNLNITA